MFLSVRSFAQDSTEIYDVTDDAKVNMFSIGVGGQYGFIFAHSLDVQNTRGANPIGAEVILGWQRNDKFTWSLCNCYPRKGLLFSFYNYDTDIVGKGAIAAYFLEPTFRITNSILFSFKGSIGLAYLSKPFHPEKNPGNMSYSTRLNGYGAVGAGLWIRMTDQLWINPSAIYQHTSNGGIKEPNKGINWPTAGLSVNYTPEPQPFYSGSRITEKYWKRLPPRVDVGVFGIGRRFIDTAGNSKRFPLLGLQAHVGKQVGRISALTAGVEVSNDKALSLKMKRDSIDASATRAGFLAGHEFLLGRFLFSQRLGVYFFNQSPESDLFFHNWGLHYRITKNWGAGFNLKAHRQVAEHVNVRLIYSFDRTGLNRTPY